MRRSCQVRMHMFYLVSALDKQCQKKTESMIRDFEHVGDSDMFKIFFGQIGQKLDKLGLLGLTLGLLGLTSESSVKVQ